jgi:hypothetical protein
MLSIDMNTLKRECCLVKIGVLMILHQAFNVVPVLLKESGAKCLKLSDFHAVSL